jgi:hypothetical protein
MAVCVSREHAIAIVRLRNPGFARLALQTHTAESRTLRLPS